MNHNVESLWSKFGWANFHPLTNSMNTNFQQQTPAISDAPLGAPDYRSFQSFGYKF